MHSKVNEPLWGCIEKCQRLFRVKGQFGSDKRFLRDQKKPAVNSTPLLKLKNCFISMPLGPNFYDEVRSEP